jgi:hypothetical protein
VWREAEHEGAGGHRAEGAGRRAANIRVCNRVAHAGERRQGSPEPRAWSGMRGSPDPREAVGRGAPASEFLFVQSAY